MITRRKDCSKSAPSKDARKIYIVCEGKNTEPNYFGFFEGLSSNLEVIIIPPHEGETDPIKLLQLAKNTFLSDYGKYRLDYMDHDTVWFTIDTDAWLAEGKIASLREFCAMQNERISQDYDEIRPYSAWNVAQSNPCFEIWLYYHHYNEPPTEGELMAHASMKELLDHKVAGGFDFQRDQVRLQDAIINSKKNYSIGQDNGPGLFSTEQHNLGEEIMRFVKTDLQKLKNKM